MTLQMLSAKSPPEALARSGGGKAANLAVLERVGCTVPHWFCVPVDAFDASLAEAVRRAGASPSDATPTGLASLPLSEDVVAAVRQALVDHGLQDAFVAVRSSGLDEDGFEHSFAGQFESYLYRRGDKAVLEAVGGCWASGFSERNVAYRAAIGANGAPPRMGVIVQLMVDSESAGVAFSRDPLVPCDRDTLIVESAWGQGEAIVGGDLDCDRFSVDRSTMEFEAHVASKTHAIVRARSGQGTRVELLDRDRAQRPSLTPDQVREVAALALHLESELGSPQDCEWAFADGQLFTLQTRPITTLPPDALFDACVTGGDVVIWDNSNIIESYSGVTTPLTFSHVSRAYREVYYQTCRLMGVPPSIVQEHEWVFRNMLGLIRGRIYYNLLNWYRLLALFPLLGRSGSFMETMMGVKQSLESDVQPLFDTVLADAPRYGIVSRFLLLVRLGWSMLGGARANEEFLARVDRVCRPLETTDLGSLSLPEQVDVYHSLEEGVLRHWTAPIVNDTRCMIAFGLLKSLSERWTTGGANGDAASLQNDLLCGEGNLKSTEPLRRLLEIARRIESDPDVRVRIIRDDPETVWAALQDGFAPDLRIDFEKYIEAYGCRCVDELKLETLDFHDQPHLVVASVQAYLRHGVPSSEEIEARKTAIRGSAEAQVRSTLGWPRRALFFAILRWTRRAISDRERLRFERTRTFGVVRRLFRGVGQNLVDLGVLLEVHDVHYLTVEEILAFVEGRPVALDLAAIAATRRSEFDAYRSSAPPPDRFLTRGAVGASLRYAPLLQSLDLLTDSADDDPDVLRGTPCCPGVVEGPVRVAFCFEDTEGLDGEILVTARTDPGWVAVFPACSGLIIERGSLLSHSAVVARELGIPTIVGVSGAPLERLKNGQRVRMDAAKGEVRIL